MATKTTVKRNKSALKNERKSAARKEINRMRRSRMRTAVKKVQSLLYVPSAKNMNKHNAAQLSKGHAVLDAVQAGIEAKDNLLLSFRAAQSIIAKQVKTRIVRKNKMRRDISRLSKKIKLHLAHLETSKQQEAANLQASVSAL